MPRKPKLRDAPIRTWRVPEDPDYRRWLRWQKNYLYQCDHRYHGNAGYGAIWCDPLIEAPAEVLADPSRCPSHLCSYVMHTSVLRWTHSFPVQWGFPTIPIPIGHTSIVEYVMRQQPGFQESRRLQGRNPDEPPGHDPHLLALANAVRVTDGREFATFVLRFPVGDGILEFFGTANEDQVIEGDGPLTLPLRPAKHGLGVNVLDHVGVPRRVTSWTYGPLLMRYTSGSLTKATPTALIRTYETAMRRIWNPLVGLPLGTGRPPNTGTFTSADAFLRAVRAAIDGLRNQGVPLQEIGQEAVAEYFCSHTGFPTADERQIRRWHTTQFHIGDWHATRTAALALSSSLPTH